MGAHIFVGASENLLFRVLTFNGLHLFFFGRGFSFIIQIKPQKENAVLFRLADQIISDEKQAELFEEFEAHEENVIGHGVHEQLHAQIHAWEILYHA